MFTKISSTILFCSIKITCWLGNNQQPQPKEKIKARPIPQVNWNWRSRQRSLRSRETSYFNWNISIWLRWDVARVPKTVSRRATTAVDLLPRTTTWTLLKARADKFKLKIKVNLVLRLLHYCARAMSGRERESTCYWWGTRWVEFEVFFDENFGLDYGLQPTKQFLSKNAKLSTRKVSNTDFKLQEHLKSTTL